jgi:hypothetical protein
MIDRRADMRAFGLNSPSPVISWISAPKLCERHRPIEARRPTGEGFKEATPTHHQPANPTDPGDAADLSTPQGIRSYRQYASNAKNCREVLLFDCPIDVARRVVRLAKQRLLSLHKNATV